MDMDASMDQIWFVDVPMYNFSRDFLQHRIISICLAISWEIGYINFSRFMPRKVKIISGHASDRRSCHETVREVWWIYRSCKPPSKWARGLGLDLGCHRRANWEHVQQFPCMFGILSSKNCCLILPQILHLQVSQSKQSQKLQFYSPQSYLILRSYSHLAISEPCSGCIVLWLTN